MLRPSDPCIFPIDCPDFGGFVSSTTIIKADFWRLGQVKAGDTLQYRRVSLEDALRRRKLVDKFIDQIASACSSSQAFEGIDPLDCNPLPSAPDVHSQATVCMIEAQGSQPRTLYRQVSRVCSPTLMRTNHLGCGRLPSGRIW